MTSKCTRTKSFCTAINCLNCFQRCFATCERSLFRSADEERSTPCRTIAKYSDKLLIFYCCTCGQWCPYCTNQKHCTDTDCQHCYVRSILSHPRGRRWSANNPLPARSVALNDNRLYLFDCETCNHEFQMSPANINKVDHWCPYCTNRRR
jgi:hypothetical protein